MSLEGLGSVVLVGAGKMGLALARGWIASGLGTDDLILVDPHPQDETGAFCKANGLSLLVHVEPQLATVLVLAVKPQIIGAVMDEVRAAIGPKTLVISIAAGISLASLTKGTGSERVVRAMPNTPAQVGKGVTGAVAGTRVTESNRATASGLLEAAGALVWFADEQKLDIVTAVSGSGPAYVFYFVEALAAAGIAEGLEPDEAMTLARATVIGAAGLLAADEAPASRLRENVTSPKGTTAAALEVLMGADGLEPVLRRAVGAARARSLELGRD